MKFWKVFESVFKVAIVVTYSIMMCVVLIQVVCRFTPFLRAPAWTEEISRFLMVYVVAFSAGFAIKTGAFVRVDTIFNIISEKNKLWMIFGGNCLLIALFSLMFVYALQFFELGIPQGAISIPKLSLSIVYFSMIMLSALTVLYLICDQINIIKDVRKLEVPKC